MRAAGYNGDLDDFVEMKVTVHSPQPPQPPQPPRPPSRLPDDG
jgi:hypothetical protein